MPPLPFLVRMENDIYFGEAYSHIVTCDLTLGTKDQTPRSFQQLTTLLPHLFYQRVFAESFRGV